MGIVRQKTLRDSTLSRWTALFLVAFSLLSAYFFVDMLAPLQKLLEVNYKWSPQVYGLFSGSEYYLNIYGFLIVSGIILDKMGIRFTGILATLIMLVGGWIKLYGMTNYFNSGGFGYEFFNSFWTTLPASAKVAAIGYAIFGVGVEMCGITVSKTIVKWFKGKEMALAMGMEMATARMGASAAFFFSAFIAGNQPVNSVIFGCALLFIGLLSFLFYTIYFDQPLDQQIHQGIHKEAPEQFRLSDLGHILSNRAFFYISCLCVLFYSGVFPFLKYAVNMMQSKLSISAETGGLIAGLLPVGAILLTPIFGYILDSKGKGISMMILGAFLLMLAHLTFAIAPLNIVLAVIAIIVLGVAFSLVPASLWPSVPKIVEERYLGSAYALIFWIQNIGLGLIPWFIGLVLNAVNPGVAERIAAGDPTAVYNYTIPMLLFALLGLVALFFGFLLKHEDRKKRYGLELPNKRKALR